MKKRILSILLFCVMLARMLPTAALAAGSALTQTHTHCICGGNTDVGDHTSHTNVTYQPWDGTSAIDYGDDNTAYVYLTDNVTIKSNLEIKGGMTLYLCLNGKTFASNGTNKIVVKENSRFILCDCAGGGTIDGADSGWGGTGIYLYNSTMDMYGGKITGGYASGNGGGGAIALDDVNCIFNMYGGEISGNRAKVNGGAIFLNGTSKSKESGTVNLYGGTISKNSAANGGAIYAVYCGSVNIYGGTISNNKASKFGGAILLNFDGQMTMSGGTITGNEASTWDGGAISLYNSTFTFSDGMITGNKAVDGGAINLDYYSQMTMTGGTISNNTATEKGGAVYMYGENSTFNFSGGTITGNEAVNGGAIYLQPDKIFGDSAQCTLNMSGGEISGNKATGNGGAVYFYEEGDSSEQGKLNISGNPVVKDNTVSGKANNIYLKSGKTLSLSIDHMMTDGASVGITTGSTNYPVAFSGVFFPDYTSYFFADDPDAYVKQNSQYRLVLAKRSHTHNWSTEWTTDGTHHWHECTAGGCDVTDNAGKQGYSTHSGTDDGDCTTAVICECGYTITAANDEHTYEWQSKNGQYWKKCKFCGDETAKKDIPTITINGADSVCITQDYKFSFTLPEGATDASYGYEFENKGNSGLPAIIENNELFGIVPVTEYEPSENSFNVYAGAKTDDGFDISASKTVALMSEHTDAAPKDHICDVCGATLSEHTGGEATCRSKAICNYCDKEYGELAPNSHADLKHFPAKEATKTAEGNIEYWYCSGCGKYYKDATATKEIVKSDTVIAKLSDDSKSPQTGDNSHISLWFALLFVSGGLLTVTSVYGKRKTHSKN